MDNAVALVQAYLRVNGYFTVSEYPVVEAVEHERQRYRTATDLDILAFRFPGATHLIPGPGGDRVLETPDPTLRCDPSHPDMIIGEVKEGRAELNRSAEDPNVLRAALGRFGCCADEEVEEVVARLMKRPFVRTAAGHRLRRIAFGSSPPLEQGPWQVVTLGAVVDFLENFIRDHWDVLHRTYYKDRAFGFLITLEKARQANYDD